MTPTTPIELPVTVAPRSAPNTVSLPPLRIWLPLSVPPALTVRNPPELTAVPKAVPPESTNIDPPLMTTSFVSIWPAVT